MKTRLTLHGKAELAIKEAVAEVIERHKQTGRPLVIWQDGKVIKVSAKHLCGKRRKKE